MKTIFLALLTLLVVNTFAFESCENFAAKYSVDRVTTELILEGTPVFANNFHPTVPLLQSEFQSDDGYMMKYETVITVSPKDEPTVATRYYVTLTVIDNDASCSLVAGSAKIELEN